MMENTHIKNDILKINIDYLMQSFNVPENDARVIVENYEIDFLTKNLDSHLNTPFQVIYEYNDGTKLYNLLKKEDNK
ncbi:hypothetical protein IQ37_17275 [Chryseobacterium piperi]|uniref:Uncharacterized protein n=1 Tax=Chryseobacterium piperi TaxID=558152 RepID=A0A086AKM1_9FLAO|nr:hypothetical protein [Chryseobacterium piperi]ASW75975.1 hypothetical protein CJF12_18005 [Chryseobacterium piperi]KFF17235.1 hypothetical protein IQ37_17275 [Chryseobacterium piperi]